MIHFLLGMLALSLLDLAHHFLSTGLCISSLDQHIKTWIFFPDTSRPGSTSLLQENHPKGLPNNLISPPKFPKQKEIKTGGEPPDSCEN